VASAEAGSFSAAARRLRKAQSAVSTQVANLEAELGLTLFSRAGRNPVLTPAGQRLLPEARVVLERREHLMGVAIDELYDALYRAKAGAPARIQHAACWAHARRKLFEVHESTRSPIAEEALRRIQALYQVEADITGLPALDCQAERPQPRSLPRLRHRPACPRAPHHQARRTAALELQGPRQRLTTPPSTVGGSSRLL
jgi:DNA-binding transcriptional LysR family regulator